MKSDLEIIRECLKGDERSCKQLYEKYVSYCYGICVRYSIQKSEMKDVVQVIFSEIFKSLDRYDDTKAQFKTWMTRICINNFLSHRKKQSRRIQTQDLDLVNDQNVTNLSNNIDEQINREYILTMIQKMPPNYQVVFNLFIIDGYSHDEISEKLDISVSASRVTLSRGRNWVKKALVNHLTS